MKKEILRMQDVRLGSYEPFGLDDFRLRICEGEFVDLIGLSGAGKTMLYEFFLGNAVLRQGKVFYNGVVCREGERFTQITEVVCIGRESTLIPGLSVAENIFIITGKRKVHGIIRMRNIYYRAKILLGQYAPELSPETLVCDLSQAGQRMVELLRAIENEVKLVVIDDVFQGYGQSDTLKLSRLMKALKEKKISILYEMHQMDFTRAFTDRAIVLRKGRTIRTFYGDDYEERFCRQLLVGNEKTSVFKRVRAKTERVVFEIKELAGEKYLRDFSMAVHEGEIIGLYDLDNYKNMELAEMVIGESPAGGSTMSLNGETYEPRDIDYAVGRNIGFMPRSMGSVSLVQSMSFMDNLYLPVMKKTSRLKIFQNRRISEFLGKEYMDSLGIPPEDRNKQVKYFDAYIQTSILLTRWILFKPTLMVCLEPWGDADLIMKGIIFRAMDEMAKNGAGILIASQNMNELKTICDIVYVMNSSVDMQVECFQLNDT